MQNIILIQILKKLSFSSSIHKFLYKNTIKKCMFGFNNSLSINSRNNKKILNNINDIKNKENNKFKKINKFSNI